MSKEEAIKNMDAGYKLTHQYFTPDEWVKSNPSGDTYTFEDGCTISSEIFWRQRQSDYWLTGWELFKHQPID